ncbi:hypothetical protein [Bradyrhizobium sp. STM 3566]|uniref:hypothetical protein n=1 Tax=Bradyrhizobium sp. STM 3566 TaxID=578928 RepID=UPI00389107AB
MPDPTAALTGSYKDIANLIVAAGGLGTAAMGLVDTSKAFAGGPSNFGYIVDWLKPFLAPPANNPQASGRAQILRTLRANWLNGVPKADQKAKAKSLIHLGLTGGAKNSEHISLLASHKDLVLKLAFPIGDPLSNLLHDDHMPFRSR